MENRFEKKCRVRYDKSEQQFLKAGNIMKKIPKNRPYAYRIGLHHGIRMQFQNRRQRDVYSSKDDVQMIGAAEM